jgi:hypothetical protein
MNRRESCLVCRSAVRPFGEAKVLLKHQVAYFECTACGFVQTEDPYWLAEAYSNAIVEADLGPLNRSISFSRITKAVILSFFDPAAKFVDYGGGYGLLVRAMRDKGFDFRRYDRYCENLFARGFDLDGPPAEKAELLTAVEVFEHLVNPIDDVRHMLEFAGSVLFTTELMPASRPRPGDWWYYVPQHGQHISIYTVKALESIASQFRLHLYSDGLRMHLLTDRKINGWWFGFVTNERRAAWIDLLRSRPSLLQTDFEAALERTARGEGMTASSTKRSA